jgi:hypothetical protein
VDVRLEASVLVGVGVGTVAATLLALAFGSLTPPISGLGLLTAAVAGACAWHELPRGAMRLRLAEMASLGLFALVALRQFLWLLVERDGQVMTWDAFNYGDLPLHITYIRFFANGAAFWPENPIFTATRLQYPIGIDVFQAMLLQLGVPLALGLALVGAVASALTALGLLRWAGSLALLAFVLSGGFGEPLAWKNLFLALLVTQRGFLFAMPAGLLVLASWRRRFVTGEGGLLPAWVEGVLWGVLPFFHLHTFLLVSFLFVVWVLAGERLGEGRRALLVAILPGALGVLLVTDFFRAASLVGWAPGWMMGAEDPLTFVIKNFTIYPLLLCVAAADSMRARDRAVLLTFVPGLFFWAALFLVKLAPWAWDNTKVMVWCYLLTLPAIGRALATLPAVARAGVLVVWLLPGTVTVADATLGSRHGYVLYDRHETDGVCEALRVAPIAARIAVEPTFNHPVALCGHPLVAGYGGHLWSHGIEPRAVEQRLATLMDGRPGWEHAASELQARFVFWGAREEAAHPGSLRPWEATRRLAAVGGWGRLYDLASAK